jgi:hypothetical protein
MRYKCIKEIKSGWLNSGSEGLTLNKVYDGSVVVTGQYGYDVQVVVFNDEREWTAYSINVFEPEYSRDQD